MINEHVFMNLVSLNKFSILINFEIWQNSACFGISTTLTKWDKV